MNKALIKDALVLFFITAIAGMLLGAVYDITKEPIENQKQKTKEKAYETVFAEADSFEAFDYADAASTLEAAGIAPVSVTIDEVMAAKKGGDTAGYVMTVTSHEGYGGDIQIAIGIQSDGTVNGISFLSISETAGLGMKAKEPAFYEQFSGKKTEAFAYTKSGASAENEIDALTGATITTNAVTNAVNGAICYFRSIEGGGSNE
ncbi:MAG: RnfABCDGE type electron transport complex subunit G [Lachnospiraceae bacterium]|nr:RnfABCDGE type electron transport complex subunit G [Lachnospiraceae bacterium]